MNQYDELTAANPTAEEAVDDGSRVSGELISAERGDVASAQQSNRDLLPTVKAPLPHPDPLPAGEGEIT